MSDLVLVSGSFSAISIIVGILVVLLSAAYILNLQKKTNKNSDHQSSNAKKPRTISSYTASEVSKHCKSDDAWIIVDKKVYDITSYVDEHPGGDSILKNVGADSSEGFHGPQHPVSVLDVIREYYIGA